MQIFPSSQSFYRANARWLAAGLLCTLASSFGQTFFISLFAGRIMALHGLSDGQWGTLYTGATLLSAAVLVQAGRLADTVPLRRLTLGVLALFAAVSVGMALNTSVILLFFLVAGLRFCGQGMMSHIGITATARWFRARRGGALAVTGLGVSLGEAILPAIVVAVVAAFGWRPAWALAALVLVVIFAPLLAWGLAVERAPEGHEAAGSPGLGGRHWTRRDALGHWFFWALLPGLLTPSFIGTVIFFHQIHIAETKGWDIATMALGYPAYAAVTVAALVAAGQVIDRWGAVVLIPVFLLPYGLAMAAIGPGEAVSTWYWVLALIGVAQGIGGAMTGALLSEVYGTRHIGAVRALVVALMVVSTAAGPGVTGLLIDAGIDFPRQGPTLALWCAALSLGFLLVARRLVAEQANGRQPA